MEIRSDSDQKVDIDIESRDYSWDKKLCNDANFKLLYGSVYDSEESNSVEDQGLMVSN